MVEPNCPRCGGVDFTAVPKKIRNWEFAVTFFCCDGCGAIVGGTFLETPDMQDAMLEGVIPVTYKGRKR